MNVYTVIFNVGLFAIGLQKLFYVETDMIMRSNMGLCSYTAFSCYRCILSDGRFVVFG